VPIYEYACQSCNNQFEVKQGFNDAPISTCSKCGGAVNKLISAPAIMFKGTGWYVTDYSDKLKPPAAEAESKEKPANGKQEAKEKKEGAPASPTATAQAGSASSAPSGTSGDSGGTSSSSSSPSSSTSSPSSSTSSTSSSSSSKTPSSEK